MTNLFRVEKFYTPAHYLQRRICIERRGSSYYRYRKTILLHLVGESGRVSLTGSERTLDAKARRRAQCAQLIKLVHSVSESLMFLAGSSAFALDMPIGRNWPG